jgi:hypothetical protein
MVVVVFDNGNWRPATWKDAYPGFIKINPENENKPLAWEYIKEPKVGYNVVDFNIKNDQLKSYHFGSEVSEVSEFTDEDKKLFFPSFFNMSLQESIRRVLKEERKLSNSLIRRLNSLDYEVERGLNGPFSGANICIFFKSNVEFFESVMENAIDVIYYKHFSRIDDGSGEWAHEYLDMVDYIRKKHKNKIMKHYDDNCGSGSIPLKESIRRILKEEKLHATPQELIKNLPKELKELLFKQWGAKQNPEWHPEGNTLKHIIVVIKRAYHHYPDDPNMVMAALFHDLGKIDTYKINPKTNQPTAYGHEDKSTDYVEKFKDWIESFEGMDVEEIKYLVKNHMKVKPSTWDQMKDKKKEPIMSHPAFDKLMGFTDKLDGGGTDLKESIRRILKEETDGVNALIDVITSKHEMSDELIEKVKDFISQSNCKKIEFANFKMPAMGVALHDGVLINKIALNQRLEYLLFIIFHETAHQYQFKKYGEDIMYECYLGDISVEEAAKLMKHTEEVADEFAGKKIKQLQKQGLLDKGFIPPSLYKNVPISQIIAMVGFYRSQLKQQNITTPDKISEFFYNMVKNNI